MHTIVGHPKSQSKIPQKKRKNQLMGRLFPPSNMPLSPHYDFLASRRLFLRRILEEAAH